MNKAVFFDIGATLIEGPYTSPAKQVKNMLENMYKHIKIDPDKFAMFENSLMVDYIDNVYDFAKLIRGLSPIIGSAYSKVVAESVWASQGTGTVQVIPGACNLLHSVTSSELRTGFISNIWKPYFETFLKLLGPYINNNNSNCVLSFMRHTQKPDVALFEQAMSEIDVLPKDSVMVGDTYKADIAPAIELGMKTIWVLHRPTKEAAYITDVTSGVLPKPTLTVNHIDELTIDIIKEVLST